MWQKMMQVRVIGRQHCKNLPFVRIGGEVETRLREQCGFQMDCRNGGLNQGVPKSTLGAAGTRRGPPFLPQRRAKIPTLCVLGVDMLQKHTWGQFGARGTEPLFHAVAVGCGTANVPG